MTEDRSTRLAQLVEQWRTQAKMTITFGHESPMLARHADELAAVLHAPAPVADYAQHNADCATHDCECGYCRGVYRFSACDEFRSKPCTCGQERNGHQHTTPAPPSPPTEGPHEDSASIDGWADGQRTKEAARRTAPRSEETEVALVQATAPAPVETPRSDWQDIATAPKDGTWIFLRGNSGYINRPYRAHIGRWCQPKPERRGWWEQSEDAYFSDDGDEPTHWMPLPSQIGVAYMPVPRCETCAYWDKGICRRIPSPQIYFSSIGVHQQISTAADFGCVQWKEK